ncbi:MAG: hypothetical protein JNL13_13935 [Chitinophagaceae bacterium]|nr:hypothetical protein [Chitinophagaceae bacterium]
MQKINLVLLATALLAGTALSSCTKEEMNTTTKTGTNMSGTKNLARGGNFVMYGRYLDDGWFDGCVGSNGVCMVIVRPVTRWINGGRYIMTPDVGAGDDKLQVDKYKASGIETSYYSQMDVTIGQNGDQSVTFTQ